ncbi:MAG: DUF2149 domain-containing protein [Firmicutes bacterium]|nr:DUF2149 domain-containing protein [Bacillota bacterium]
MESEDINPMEYVANLADVMLVFACGLMLALITYWNVDVVGIGQTAVDINQGQEVTSQMQNLTDEQGEGLEGSGLNEYGKVYQDPETGKLYMVMEG